MFFRDSDDEAPEDMADDETSEEASLDAANSFGMVSLFTSVTDPGKNPEMCEEKRKNLARMKARLTSNALEYYRLETNYYPEAWEQGGADEPFCALAGWPVPRQPTEKPFWRRSGRNADIADSFRASYVVWKNDHALFP